MISPTAITSRRILLVAFLWAIVANETRASTAFVLTPNAQQPTRQPAKRRFVHRPALTRIRGGAKAVEEKESLQDCGGSVAGLFGNLRIPASLIAGAALGSAFALPFLDTDSAKIAMAKRLYAVSMITTLGSMLLVVIIATITMNDIAIRPKRLSQNVGEYIQEHYELEWMLVRSHFFYGAFAFLGGSAFRAYVAIACPVIGKGVLGILASLSLVCMGYFVEKTSHQNCPCPLRLGRFLKVIGDKAKTNVMFGAGAITWLVAVTYLLVKVPHMYTYLVMR